MTGSTPGPGETRPPEGWWSTAVLGMGLASLFCDLGHEMATAALPAFLATIGGSPGALGIVEGVADGLSSGVKLLAAAVFALLVRRDDRPPHPHLSVWDGLTRLPSSFRRFLVAVARFGLGDFPHTLLILRSSELLTPVHGAAAAAATAIAFYVGHNVVYALASYPVGHLADRVGKRPLLVSGYALGAAVALGFAFAPGRAAVLGLLFVAAGLVLAAEDTLEGSMAAERVHADSRGTGFGVLAATNGVGDFVSSTAIGLLWSHGGASPGFGVAALLCAAGAASLAFVPSDDRAA